MELEWGRGEYSGSGGGKSVMFSLGGKGLEVGGPFCALLQGIQMSADLYEHVIHRAFCIQL